MQPLSGILVVDFSRYLPGAFASRELLELGARVVCVEPPGGDPMRSSAPAWDAALRAGKESFEVDLKGDAAPALELVRKADVVLESFRPGVASRLGIGPISAPSRPGSCWSSGRVSCASSRPAATRCAAAPPPGTRHCARGRNRSRST